jgi:FkbM family methyltransferase
MMLEGLRGTIRRNRRRFPFSLVAAACEKYLRAWHNEGYYDFERNGEAFVLRQLSAWASRPATVWDVGAHEGEWAEAAHGILPDAEVHSFEILPEIARRVRSESWRTVHEFGLSDRQGTVDVHWNVHHDTTNSILPRSESVWFKEGTQVVTARITTGDAACASIRRPDVLKIDVEGHEAAVLRGCQNILTGVDPPWLVQVEYGETYIPYGAFLRDIYGLLPGYSIGRAFPDHVEFRDYSYADENFRMGNYVAVRDPALRDLLANRR